VRTSRGWGDLVRVLWGFAHTIRPAPVYRLGHAESPVRHRL